jgi:hypothetical protein
MSSVAVPTSEKIVLNFAWTGPNTWRGGSSRWGLDIRVVDLVFKDAKTDVSVHLPQNINPVVPQKFPFTCRKSWKETHPDSLCVTTEQVRNLVLKAGVFEKGRPIGPMVMDSSGRITQQETLRRSDEAIGLEVPEELELGQTYNLVVLSEDLSLSARLVKATVASPSAEDRKEATRDEFRGRMGKMGEALIAEGVRNLGLDSKGAFDSSSTADVVAHGIRGVIRAGQEMHPEIRMPYSKPAETASDLNKLSVAELESRFEAAFKQDKEFESQRIRIALAGNIPEMNRILEAETANSQLLMNLAEALERKGVEPTMPKSGSFMSAARESAELHDAALKGLQDNCKVQ